MNFQSLILLVFVYFTSSIAAIDEYDLYKRFPDLHLMNVIARSKILLQINPSSSTAECFDAYMLAINEASAKYEDDYKACLDATQAERAKAEEATVAERAQLADRAKNACDLISPCSETPSAIGVFQCYIKAGSDNLKSMRSISSDATVQLAALNEQYRLIANIENTCTKQTKRTFDAELDDAYENLNECIQASLPVIPTRLTKY